MRSNVTCQYLLIKEQNKHHEGLEERQNGVTKPKRAAVFFPRRQDAPRYTPPAATHNTTRCGLRGPSGVCRRGRLSAGEPFHYSVCLITARAVRFGERWERCISTSVRHTAEKGRKGGGQYYTVALRRVAGSVGLEGSVPRPLEVKNTVSPAKRYRRPSARGLGTV